MENKITFSGDSHEFAFGFIMSEILDLGESLLAVTRVALLLYGLYVFRSFICKLLDIIGFKSVFDLFFVGFSE